MVDPAEMEPRSIDSTNLPDSSVAVVLRDEATSLHESVMSVVPWCAMKRFKGTERSEIPGAAAKA